MVPSAASADAVYETHTQAELIAEERSVQPGRPFWVALRLSMDEDWHTYWRNPGDSGLATSVRWDLPQGFQSGPLQWPYPQEITFEPLTSYGYEGEVLLLTKITPPLTIQKGETELRARVSWLACRVECVPGQADLVLNIPVKEKAPQRDPRWIEGFDLTRRKLPLSESGWKIRVEETEGDLVFLLAPPSWGQYKVDGIRFFPYRDDLIRHDGKQTLNRGETGYRLVVSKSHIAPKTIEKIQGILVSTEGWKGYGSRRSLLVDEQVEDNVENPPAGPGPATVKYLIPVVFAFLGGILLNVMPCVLPILSIKVLHFVKQADEDRRRIWRHGLTFSLGILTAFWILAGILVALRAGGQRLGWGFQLQSPVFVAFLAVLFFVLGMNLFGVFEIGTTFARLGRPRAFAKSRYTESFLSGMLTTVVATPCTAPFMGTALGVALTQGSVFSRVVFTSLGLGLSLPYLILSRFPGLVGHVPRPGPWMVRLKQFLGFFLMATVVWLMGLLGLQKGVQAMTLLSLGLVIIGLGGWVLGAWTQPAVEPKIKYLARAGALILFIVGFLSGWKGATLKTDGPVTRPDDKTGVIAWQAYSPELIQRERKNGRIIFADFTAAWCFTCQVNERITLQDPQVVQKFQQLDVVPVKGDWTSQDESVSLALESFGRTSVPLYVVYPKDEQEEPFLLPEIITPRIVLQALEKANNAKE